MTDSPCVSASDKPDRAGAPPHGGGSSQLSSAVLDAVSEGIRTHLPVAIGILLRSLAIAASAWAIAHALGGFRARTIGAGAVVTSVAAARGPRRATSPDHVLGAPCSTKRQRGRR